MTPTRGTVAAIVLLSLLIGYGSGLRAQSQPFRTAVRTLQVPSSRSGEAAVVSAVAVSPDGSYLAAAGDDHLVHVFGRGDGRLVKTLAGHRDWVRTLGFSPDGRWLFSAGDDRQVIRWQVGTWQPQGRFFFPGRSVYALIVLPQAVVLAGYEPRVLVFDFEGNQQAAWPTTCRDVRAVCVAPQGDMIAAAGQDGVIHLWSWPQGKLLWRQKAHRRRVRALAFSPDGKLLASGGEGLTVAVWNLEERTPLLRLRSRPGRVLALAFLEPGLLATAGTDNQIRLWDLKQAKTVARLVGHKGSVTSLVWLAKDKLLISGSYDTTLRYWDLGPQGALIPALHR